MASFSKRLKQAWLQRISTSSLEGEFYRRLIGSLPVSPRFLNGRDYSSKQINDVPSESGIIVGEVVHLLETLATKDDKLLLLGERNAAKTAYGKAAGIDVRNITTAGLHGDMDHRWDYEQPAPAGLEECDLIASQAMIEHLVDPYKHLRDCYELLCPGGHLIVHTVLPGFHYHAYPIDCLRFYPDWFEAVATRLGAKVQARMISSTFFIVYCLHKPANQARAATPAG